MDRKPCQRLGGQEEGMPRRAVPEEAVGWLWFLPFGKGQKVKAGLFLSITFTILVTSTYNIS